MLKFADKWIWDCPPSEWRSSLSGGWNRYTRDLGTALIEGNITAVREIGIQLTNLSGIEIKDSIFLDDISW